MDYEANTSKDRYRRWLIGFMVISVIIVGAMILVAYNLFESWTYDPKQSAKDTVNQCLNQSSEACGYLDTSPCLTAMHEAASFSRNQYSIDVLWYNREDEICCRGGDEVYLQLNFTNGDSYRLLWYEGTLEQCEAAVP